LTTYGLVAAGISAFLIISAVGALYCRAKKVGTVKPWVTGLSGQLQKAFVTGTFVSALTYMYLGDCPDLTSQLNHNYRCACTKTVRAGIS
jgi:hypothetical protein